MLKRKITERLERFFSDDGRYALLVDGARQVGKTFIIEDFARRRYENFIEINFVKTPSAKRIFENVEDENDILEKLSTFSRKGLIRGKTLVFLDEVQECPEAVTYIKFLVQDGTCHYILSGSLLGVELKNVRSVPVGFMDEVKMYPLDFEEFVLANGEREELIAAARKSWEERRPLDRLYHERLSKLFRLYLVVGGMPAAVQRYLDTHDISAVVKEQEQILVEYRKDITKYDKENSLRIREVFERIAPDCAGAQQEEQAVLCEQRKAGGAHGASGRRICLVEGGWCRNSFLRCRRAGSSACSFKALQPFQAIHERCRTACGILHGRHPAEDTQFGAGRQLWLGIRECSGARTLCTRILAFVLRIA